MQSSLHDGSSPVTPLLPNRVGSISAHPPNAGSSRRGRHLDRRRLHPTPYRLQPHLFSQREFQERFHLDEPDMKKRRTVEDDDTVLPDVMQIGPAAIAPRTRRLVPANKTTAITDTHSRGDPMDTGVSHLESMNHCPSMTPRVNAGSQRAASEVLSKLLNIADKDKGHNFQRSPIQSVRSHLQWQQPQRQQLHHQQQSLPYQQHFQSQQQPRAALELPQQRQPHQQQSSMTASCWQ